MTRPFRCLGSSTLKPEAHQTSQAPQARRQLCLGSPLMSAHPMAAGRLLPQPGFSGFSAHLLCFVYKMVRLVPVGEEVCGLFIIDSDVMIRK